MSAFQNVDCGCMTFIPIFMKNISVFKNVWPRNTHDLYPSENNVCMYHILLD
jgi:hypothetical protein